MSDVRHLSTFYREAHFTNLTFHLRNFGTQFLKFMFCFSITASNDTEQSYNQRHLHNNEIYADAPTP